MMKDKIAILFVIEPGYLEQQAKLLINSIHKFVSNDLYTTDLFSFSPRKNKKPGSEITKLLSSGVTHHFNENLNIELYNFPLINGHIGASFFEKNYPQYNKILLVDTDTVFLNNINYLMNLENDQKKLLLSPVDNKGVGSSGEHDENHEFWALLYQLLDIPLPNKFIQTTVRQNIIWPYYNAGFVFSKNINGFFTQWLNDFKKIYHSNIRSNYSGKDGTKTLYLEQVALALTSQRYQKHIEILPQSYNYPIPFRPIMKNRPEHPKFEELVHVHYHKWFQHPGFLDYVTDEEEKKSEQYLWLKEHLPLLPTIDDPFKC